MAEKEKNLKAFTPEEIKETGEYLAGVLNELHRVHDEQRGTPNSFTGADLNPASSFVQGALWAARAFAGLEHTRVELGPYNLMISPVELDAQRRGIEGIGLLAPQLTK